MTGINFRIWRKKTERAVTRQHTSRPFCTMTWQQETRYRLRDNSWMVYYLCNVYWRGHKGITLPGNDVAVAKSKAKTRRFVANCRPFSASFCRLSVNWKKIVATLLSNVACRQNSNAIIIQTINNIARTRTPRAAVGVAPVLFHWN